MEFSTSKAISDQVSIAKFASRLTAGHINLKGIDKHGIIMEDQNESDGNSSGSDSSGESVSGNDSADEV